MKDKNIEDYLSEEVFKSRQELSKETGLSEREVRRSISNLKFKKPVIYNSHTKGYRLVKYLPRLTTDEIQSELELINHSIRDMQSRIKVFNKQLKTYISYKKIAEKLLK